MSSNFKFYSIEFTLCANWNRTHVITRKNLNYHISINSGHRVIDITNGHFIHVGPLEGTRVSIYLSINNLQDDY